MADARMVSIKEVWLADKGKHLATIRIQDEARKKGQYIAAR